MKNKEKPGAKSVRVERFVSPQLAWIISYIEEEGFPKEHLEALCHIVGLFNDCEESEKEIFDFAHYLRKKYQAKVSEKDKMDEIEKLQEKMHKIKTWINAYPLNIFPEPDFKKVHEILQRHGISLDAISASNMRHVLNGIKNIIEADNNSLEPTKVSEKERIMDTDELRKAANYIDGVYNDIRS